MTHEELLAKINDRLNECTTHDFAPVNFAIALRKIVKLHRPKGELDWAECDWCDVSYPCETIQLIEKELG